MCFLVVSISIPASPTLQDELWFCMSLPVCVCWTKVIVYCIRSLELLIINMQNFFDFRPQHYKRSWVWRKPFEQCKFTKADFTGGAFNYL